MKYSWILLVALSIWAQSCKKPTEPEFLDEVPACNKPGSVAMIENGTSWAAETISSYIEQDPNVSTKNKRLVIRALTPAGDELVIKLLDMTSGVGNRKFRMGYYGNSPLDTLKTEVFFKKAGSVWSFYPVGYSYLQKYDSTAQSSSGVFYLSDVASPNGNEQHTFQDAFWVNICY